jgi:hypothetical protein
MVKKEQRERDSARAAVARLWGFRDRSPCMKIKTNFGGDNTEVPIFLFFEVGSY